MVAMVISLPEKAFDKLQAKVLDKRLKTRHYYCKLFRFFFERYFILKIMFAANKIP